jgi:putative tricarboxylic transport membrane protein
MGAVGYWLRKLKFDVAPLILAIVLGPLMEKSFRQSLFMSQGDLWIFVQRPVSGTLLALLLVVLLAPSLYNLIARRRQPAVQ